MPNTKRDVKNFMDHERLASFATVDPSGAPHVVPVFFTYDRGRVYVQTARSSRKVRNLMTNRKATVAVYRGEEAVIMTGEAWMIESHEEFVSRTRDHVAKYELQLDSDGRDSLGIPLFDKNVRCVLELTPKSIHFW